MRLVYLALLVLVAASAHAGEAMDVHEERVLIVDGLERSYFLHASETLEPGAPLVVVLHGLGGRAEKLRYGTRLNALADAHGFAVVYPQGEDFRPTSSHWNAGFPFSDVDDVSFLTALVETLEAEHGFAPDATFAVGISNGGYMAYHMACEAAEVFDGIAAIAATMSGTDWAECAPTRPTPLLHIHGRQDDLIQWEGNSHWMSGFAEVPAIPEVVDSWVDRNDAELGFIEQRGKTRLEHYVDATGAEAVWFAAIREFGHDLPNYSNSDFSAMELSWEFFSKLLADDAPAAPDAD